MLCDILDGIRNLFYGTHYMVYGIRYMVYGNGMCYMVVGAWYVVCGYGTRYLMYMLRYMVYGTCYMSSVFSQILDPMWYIVDGRTYMLYVVFCVMCVTRNTVYVMYYVVNVVR